jgi:hypothetical protein
VEELNLTAEDAEEAIFAFSVTVGAPLTVKKAGAT